MSVSTNPGVIRRDGDLYAVRFSREYAASVDETWAAITSPQRTARWLGRIEGEPGQGATVDLVMGDEPTERARLDIVECRHPHRVAVEWTFPGEPPTRLTVDLTPLGPERTLVVLDHTGFPAETVANYGCGWHHFVDSLAAHLADAPLPAFEEYFPATLGEWKERLKAAG